MSRIKLSNVLLVLEDQGRQPLEVIDSSFDWQEGMDLPHVGSYSTCGNSKFHVRHWLAVYESDIFVSTDHARLLYCHEIRCKDVWIGQCVGVTGDSSGDGSSGQMNQGFYFVLWMEEYEFGAYLESVLTNLPLFLSLHMEEDLFMSGEPSGKVAGVTSSIFREQLMLIATVRPCMISSRQQLCLLMCFSSRTMLQRTDPG